ncbi:uncharacterized protein [Mytilus edulis]|uniref:uncharacterized protein n=1 Tax=Mytilus edulis TaxID=6550 RepID=UPI0039F0ACE3
MDSGKKYKKGGGSSCAVNGCCNNRRKLNLWKESMCEIHGQFHEDCACLIPYKFHLMPSDCQIRAEWTKAINRKTLPKTVFVCSEHFLDGLPTERNPFPKLKMGYERKVTPGRRKIHKHDSDVKKRKLIDCDDDNSDFEELDLSLEVTDQSLPEAVCSFNVVNPTTSCASTQYEETDFVLHNDHSYAHAWTDLQDKSAQTNLTLTEEKGVQIKLDVGTMSASRHIVTDSDSLLHTGVTKEVFFTLVECMSQFNTFSFQLDIADQIMLVLMRLKLNLIFQDLGRRFGISDSLACKMFNSRIPLLADKLKALIIWLPRETLRD